MSNDSPQSFAGRSGIQWKIWAKKREPIHGSLVANTTKYTRFLPKSQALPCSLLMSFDGAVRQIATTLPARPCSTRWRGIGCSCMSTPLGASRRRKGAIAIVKDHLRILEENEHIGMMGLLSTNEA